MERLLKFTFKLLTTYAIVCVVLIYCGSSNSFLVNANLISGGHSENHHCVYLDGTNVIIQMRQPTTGFSYLGKREFYCDLDHISKDVYEIFNGFSGIFHCSGEYTVFVEFYDYDMFGQRDLHKRKKITTIYANTASDFVNSSFFEKHYHIASKISNL